MRVRAWQTVAITVAACLCVSASAQERPDLVGRAAPTFELPLASPGAMTGRSKTWALTSAPAKPTVIVFTATDCPVSNAYNERMARVAKEYAPRGVDFLGINSNASDSSEAVARHAKENDLPFAVAKDADNRVADLYRAQVTPEAYVVDTRGIVRYHGRIDNSRNPVNVKTHELQDALDAVLAGQAVPKAATQAFGCAIKRVEAD